MLWDSVVQEFQEGEIKWPAQWPVFLSLDIFSTSFVPMKVHLASSKWLYLSVSAALSLCCLPNPIARSAHMLLLLLTGHVNVYTTYDKVTSTSLYQLFFFHFSFVSTRRWLEVCVSSIFKVHIYKHLLGKSRMVSWVIEKQHLFLFHGFLFWFSFIYHPSIGN